MHARLAAPPAPESFADVKPPHSGARCVRLGDGRVVYQEASHEDIRFIYI